MRKSKMNKKTVESAPKPATSRAYACRPTGMYSKRNYYYPEGAPAHDDDPLYNLATYRDKEGSVFYICYTEQQFKKHLADHNGVYCPFAPLFLSEAA